MEIPETRYARSGDLQIAYQVVGEGPLNVVVVPSYLSNIEMYWEVPLIAQFQRRLASFSRLILLDRRGSGMSDGVAGVTPLEEQIDDVQAVIDAVGARATGAVLLSRGLRPDCNVRGHSPGPRARPRPPFAPASPGRGTWLRVGAECRGAWFDGSGHRRFLGHRVAGKPDGRSCRR